MADYFKILNSTYLSVGSFFFFRQINKTFHLHNYVHELRALYLISQLIIFGINYLMIHKIKQKNDTTTLVYTQPASKGFILKATEEKQVSTTVRDYDLSEVYKGLKRAAIGIAILMVLHFRFGLVPPLFAQSIMGIKGSLTTKEAQIHIWSCSSQTGELQRPFKSEALFSKLMRKKTNDKPNAKDNVVVSTKSDTVIEQKKLD